MAGRDAYRIRVGAYRVIYEIEDGRLLVLVVKVGPRGSVYDP
jgi:mRNA interferase RelE/StbE